VWLSYGWQGRIICSYPEALKSDFSQLISFLFSLIGATPFGFHDNIHRRLFCFSSLEQFCFFNSGLYFSPPKSHKMSAPTLESELSIEHLQLKKAALILRAVNHKLRQQLLQLLHQHGRMTVTTLYQKLHLEQPVASQHLAILRKAGFAIAERNGKFIFYSVNYKRLQELHRYAGQLLAAP
jgi:DNA-binding transcriptional ArsR family regulator